MNTAYSLWRELAILASLPYGWILPVGGLFLLFCLYWLALEWGLPKLSPIFRRRPTNLRHFPPVSESRARELQVLIKAGDRQGRR